MSSPARVAWLAPVVGLVVTGTAHAGPVEELVQVARHPAAPNVLALRYENGGDGILYSRDGGGTFGLLCSAQVASDLVARRAAAYVHGDGSLFVRGFDGLFRDDGQGCNFARESRFDGMWVSHLEPDPRDPQVLYATTSGSDDLHDYGIHVRDAEGTWSTLGTLEPRLVVFSLRVVVKGEGLRFYETLARVPVDQQADPIRYFVRHSDDLGASWTEHPLLGINGTVLIEAVDPTNVDRLLLSAQGEGEDDDSLWLSSDAGKTRELYLHPTELGGVTMAQDGRVWIADAGYTPTPNRPKGLWFAPTLAQYPVQIDEEASSCVSYDEAQEALWVCRRDRFSVLREGQAEEERVAFRTVSTFVSCAGVDGPKVCEKQLCADYCGPAHFASAPVCEAYDTPSCGPRADDYLKPDDAGTASDAGSSDDAGMPMPGPAPTDKKSKDGCSVVSAGAPAGSPWALGVVGLAWCLAAVRRMRARRVAGEVPSCS